MRKILLALSALIFCFSILSVAQTPAQTVANLEQPKKEIKLSDEDAVYEAGFRIMLGRWLSNNTERYPNYYLKIEGKKDPSGPLMEKLSDLGVQIRKASDCFIFDKDGSIVLDKVTKKQGILFSISKLKWTSKDEVKFGGYDHEGNMGAFGCTYTLKREDGKWKMDKAEECWIS